MTYKAGVDYAEDDKAMSIVAEYYGRLEAYRSDEAGKKERKAGGQVYTPVEVANFMCRSVIELTLEHFAEGDQLPPISCQDPFCGSGIFPLIMLRLLHEKTGVSKKDLVEHTIMANDIDLGAVNACKAALRVEVGSHCKTNVEWGDTLAGFFVESEPLAHITDMGQIAKFNASFQADLTRFLEARDKT